MPGKLATSTLRSAELFCYTVGVLLACFFAVQLAQGEVQRRSDIAAFTQQHALPADAEIIAPDTLPEVAPPDTTLWAAGRIADYQFSLSADIPSLLGILAIPAIGLEVPIYPTDSELLMDRGSGVIRGMSYPHEGGNIGIAGHRDGYFRALKDVRPGDKMLLQTLEGPKQFTVDTTQVVEASDTALLRDTQEQTVTLVTCYPFYFVGHAPQRFIVTASLDTINVIQH